jgi:hypothetical protein
MMRDGSFQPITRSQTRSMNFKLLILLFLPIIFAQQCLPTRYWDVDHVCQPGNATIDSCKLFLKCVNGKCQKSHIGAKCMIKADCSFLSQGIECINGVCTKQRYNGYDCTVNEHCFSGRCENGVCQGLGLGSTCDPTKPVSCSKGLFCSTLNKVCAIQRKRSESCADIDMNSIGRGSNYNVVCAAGTKCAQSGRATNMTCEPVYWKKEGDRCDFGEQCHPPYTCDVRSALPRCVLRTDQKPCPSRENPNQYCFFYENCECEKCIKQWEWNACDYMGTFDRWNKCWQDSNCPFDAGLTIDDWYVDSFDSSTCLSKNCRHIVNDFMCCAMSYKKGDLANANRDPLGCTLGISPWWWLLLFVLMIIPCVLGLVLGLVMWKVLKKTNYQEIE